MGTTSEKLTYLNTTKGKIKDSINLTGANITTEPFRQYSTKLENAYIDIINNGTDTLYNNFPKVSGEGTSLTLNNTYLAPMRNNLKGNTSQTGTPTPTSPIPVNVVSGDNEIFVNGKNLFDIGIDLTSWLQTSNNGLTINNYTIGRTTATISGNKLTIDSYNTSGYTWISKWVQLEKNTDYIISGTNDTALRIVGINSKNVNSVGTLIKEKGNSQSQTFNSGSYNYYLLSMYPSAQNKYFENIMIEKGSSASTYEPYQGDTYNIDLPMGINLYDFMNNTYNNEGNLTITKLSNGFTFTNNLSNLGRIIFSNATVDSSKNYVISFEIDNPSGKLARLGWSGSSKTVETRATSGKITGVLTGITTSAFSIYIDGNSTITITNLMYYEGTDTSKTYEPYGTTPIELCKIGNYQDYFYKDSDKWYLHKEIEKVILNGTEPTWARADGNNDYRDFRIPLSDIALANTEPIGYIDNRFVAKTSSYWNENGEHLVQMNDKRLSFRIAVSRLTDSTRESWISWLTNNHITTYYALATPTNTEITDTTLINQLEELYIAKSKENQTNISQINNDLPFIISASALKKG